MKISEVFKLNAGQSELDFVDIDPGEDSPLFLDPFLISKRIDETSTSIDVTIKNYFQYLIDLIKVGNLPAAKDVFTHLNEPNDTCFGFSKAMPQGRGIAKVNSERIFESILSSDAIKTGLVTDLEDTAIFIEGVGPDLVSDMTTQIIRKDLIEYTKIQSSIWGIPLQVKPTGIFWDVTRKEWREEYDQVLVIGNRRILLVPKYIVSYYRVYIDQQYHQHFVLEYLQSDHLARNTPVVEYKTLKSGEIKRVVTKKKLKEKVAPLSKEFLREFTKQNPQVFHDFQEQKKSTIKSLDNDDLETFNLDAVVNHIISKPQSTDSGTGTATVYHRTVVGALELLFYPKLVSPKIELEINDGRKRVDIVFQNGAESGFFFSYPETARLPMHNIMIECKNYEEDPKNPELDQLSGRLSWHRGMFGILVCRNITNTTTFMSRCKDFWKDKGELIIGLTDSDLILLLNKLKAGDQSSIDAFLLSKSSDVTFS